MVPEPSMQRGARWRLLMIAAMLAFASTTQGQQDTKVSREREALRRSQAALRQAQEQQAALAKEKADLQAEGTRREDALQRVGSQLGSARSEAARMQGRAAQLALQIDADKAAAARELKSAQDAAARQSEAAAERIGGVERQLNERTQTVAGLSALLERSTQALAASEEANRKMYAFGRDLIEQYRRGVPPDALLASDAVLGLASVRREEQAELLRSRFEALRHAASAPR